MDDELLLIATLFSETKDLEDAMNIANTILNRTKNPKRYGEGIRGVILKPKQFSGVNSKEFKKVIEGNLTPEEQKIVDQFKIISKNALFGTLADTTNGATHYFNPKLVRPKWSENMIEVDKTDFHTFFKDQGE